MPRRARAERDREKYEIMVGAKKLERAESVLKIIWSENNAESDGRTKVELLKQPQTDRPSYLILGPD